MVHIGKLWRTNIHLRIFTTIENWPEWIPLVSLMTARNWAGSIAHPADTVEAEAELWNYTVGDQQIEYRTAQVGPGPELVQIGWQRRLLANHETWETILQVWADDVTQFDYSANAFTVVTWSNFGPAFPLVNKKAGAIVWPTSDFGQLAKLY